MNKLKLRYFDSTYDLALQDDAFVENGGHKFLYEYRSTRVHANFVEFEIDGKNLMSRFWSGEHRKFLNFFTGLLGYISRGYDELMISYLLGQEISEDLIINVFEGYQQAHDQSTIDDLLRVFKGNKLLIYGYPICGYGESCGGIKLQIEIHERFCHWYISPEHEYWFERKAYENELQQYLKRMQQNEQELDASMGLYHYYDRQPK